MQLSIKNRQVVDLAEEVARLTGESKTHAIRRTLQERRARLRAARADGPLRSDDLQASLEAEIWPLVPPVALDKTLTRDEEGALLGHGESGA